MSRQRAANQPTSPGQRSQVQITVELPDDLEAVYSNFVVITHAPSEIVIDFARLLPRRPRSKVYARVVMTPMHAKLLHRHSARISRSLKTDMVRLRHRRMASRMSGRLDSTEAHN